MQKKYLPLKDAVAEKSGRVMNVSDDVLYESAPRQPRFHCQRLSSKKPERSLNLRTFYSSPLSGLIKIPTAIAATMLNNILILTGKANLAKKSEAYPAATEIMTNCPSRLDKNVRFPSLQNTFFSTVNFITYIAVFVKQKQPRANPTKPHNSIFRIIAFAVVIAFSAETCLWACPVPRKITCGDHGVYGAAPLDGLRPARDAETRAEVQPDDVHGFSDSIDRVAADAAEFYESRRAGPASQAPDPQKLGGILDAVFAAAEKYGDAFVAKLEGAGVNFADLIDSMTPRDTLPAFEESKATKTLTPDGNPYDLGSQNYMAFVFGAGYMGERHLCSLALQSVQGSFKNGQIRIGGIIDRSRKQLKKARAAFRKMHQGLRVPAGFRGDITNDKLYDRIIRSAKKAGVEKDRIIAIVAVNDELHYPVVEKLAEKGIKLILVEKPVAITPCQVRKMIGLRDKYGCQIIGQSQLLYSQVSRRLQTLMKDRNFKPRYSLQSWRKLREDRTTQGVGSKRTVSGRRTWDIHRFDDPHMLGLTGIVAEIDELAYSWVRDSRFTDEHGQPYHNHGEGGLLLKQRGSVRSMLVNCFDRPGRPVDNQKSMLILGENGDMISVEISASADFASRIRYIPVSGQQEEIVAQENVFGSYAGALVNFIHELAAGKSKDSKSSLEFHLDIARWIAAGAEQTPEDIKAGLAEEGIAAEQILADELSIRSYGMDASIFKGNPKAIVMVERHSDVEKAVRFAKDNAIPVTARGGASSLAGQGIGNGIILDFSRCRDIGKPEEVVRDGKKEMCVRVGPGVTCAQLNRQLERYGLWFPPDPASKNMATTGGMIADNSSGMTSGKYGVTGDYVVDLRVVFSDGTSYWTSELGRDDPRVKRVWDLIEANKTELEGLRERFKGLSKNTSGYNVIPLLDELNKEKPDITQIFVGSEGTLGIVTEAKLKVIVPPAAQKATSCIFFENAEEAGKVVVESLLKLEPSCIEILDRTCLDLCKDQIHDIPDDAEAMLLVEFDDKERAYKMNLLRERLSSGYNLAGEGIRVLSDEKEVQQVWQARRSIQPSLRRSDPKRRPLMIMEDISVPFERVAQMIGYVSSETAKAGMRVAIAGHIIGGNLHPNILVDFSNEDEVRKACKLYLDIYNKTLELGGTTSAEHGDGRLRGMWLRKTYGDKIYNLFADIKVVLDPHKSILNPGVIISEAADTRREPTLEDILKIVDSQYLADIDRDGMCERCQECRHVCPAFVAQGRVASASPGGRYNFGLSFSELIAQCFLCWACLPICPAGINVPMRVFQERAKQPSVIAKIIVWLMNRDIVFQTGGRLIALFRPLWDSPAGRIVMEYALGIKRDIVFPEIKFCSIRAEYPKLAKLGPEDTKIAFFPGCAADMFDDGSCRATLEALKNLGAGKDIPALPKLKCCALPFMSFGLKDMIVRNARFNIDALQGYETIIADCPSCTSMLKHYPLFFSDDPVYQVKALKLVKKVVNAEEYICNLIESGKIQQLQGRFKAKVTYHQSCHERSQQLSPAVFSILENIEGVELIEAVSWDECCGGGGTRMFLHPEESHLVFNDKKLKDLLELREAGVDYVVTWCPICRMQINTHMQQYGMKAVHPLGLLNMAYAKLDKHIAEATQLSSGVTGQQVPNAAQEVVNSCP